MRLSITSILLITATSSLCFYAVSRADGLVGLWREDISNTNNMVETYQTIEFGTNGSVAITKIIKGKVVKDMRTPFWGTYTMIDSNTVRLELKSDSMRPNEKAIDIESFAITGDRLGMISLTTGVVPKTQKYRRVKP